MKNFLYDPACLEVLDFSSVESKFNPKISVVNPGPHLVVRPLSLSDFDAGYIELLSQLTEVGVVTQEQFIERFNEMKAVPKTYYVTVIEDKTTGEVIGSGTLLVEHKFIHGCANRGRIEDVVISDKYRGKQLGKLIVTTLVLLSKEVNCYKITLDCRDEMRPFYECLGFRKEETNSNFMQMRFS
ncbi:hypothetical protein AAG570_011909 [Ranatra chinensis]|uniref:Glucosamine 6-phosphate N-acetyltransferase n=1 Tax=Ranatra chinensis TaxID=642074 RepID=A0ABD0YHD7_9HEMI